MARLRTIKPGFFTNDDLAECQPLARLLFAGLWTIADREGRLEDRPKRIKAEVLPYDDCDVDALLGELAAHGFIIRYQSGGARYIACPTWKKHQNPHVKEGTSLIPAPPETGRPGDQPAPAPDEHRASTVQAPDEHSSSRAVLVLGLDSCLGNGIQTPLTTSEGAPAAADAAPGALVPAQPVALSPPADAAVLPGRKLSHEDWERYRRIWEALASKNGPAATDPAKRRRGAAVQQLLAAHYDGPDITRCFELWSQAMPSGTRTTDTGVVSNIDRILNQSEGPPTVRREVVQRLHQNGQAPRDDMAAVLALRARKAR